MQGTVQRATLWLAALALVPARALATDYYVRTSGDDSLAGTSTSTAWRTPARVGMQRFQPGDRILFEAGATYDGGITLGAEDAGTAASPVLLGVFGGTRATIHVTTGAGIYVYNAGGVRIEHLDVTSSPANGTDGVAFYMDQPGGVRLDVVQIDDVHATGFGRTGITVGSHAGRSGYRHVAITNSVARNNLVAGISVWGEFATTAGYSHEDVVIRGCRAEENPGIAGRTTNTGNGIVIAQVDGALIERSVARANGASNTAVGGPVGIWAWDCNSVTMQFNESFANRTNSTADGGGFDFDGGMTNSVMQFNYSHDNYGAGLLLAQFPGARPFGGNTVRYNISQNDGRRNSYGALMLWSDGLNEIRDSHVYDNTLFVSPAPTGTPRGIHIAPHSTRAVSIRNNLVVTTGGIALIDVAADQQSLAIEGNAYWPSGATATYRSAGSAFTSLPAFRAASPFESLDGLPTGFEVDPMLVAPGLAPTIDDPALLAGLDAYRLREGSPLIDRGLDLRTRFAIDPGATDFYGTPIPQGAGFDIGAHEFWRGVVNDAGTGPADASGDAGVVNDAGSDGAQLVDASAQSDAITSADSASDSGRSTERPGCQCNVPARGQTHSARWSGCLAAWFLVRRRRRREVT